MGDSSSKLFQLHPVTFFYKPEYDAGAHSLQYGLIAEEVAKVYPEMVAYDNDGKPLTVNFQFLAPMLLNELQQQAAQIHALKQQLDELQSKLSQGFYDARELNDVVVSLQRVVDSNRLAPRDRDILAEDLRRLDDFRVRHENYGAR